MSKCMSLPLQLRSYMVLTQNKYELHKYLVGSCTGHTTLDVHTTVLSFTIPSLVLHSSYIYIYTCNTPTVWGNKIL